MTWRHTLVRWSAALLRTDPADVVDWDDLDVGEYVDPIEHVDWDALDYQDLEARLDERHYRDPVRALEELPDEDGTIYYWECATEEAAQQITRMLEEHFLDTLGQEPRAAHLVLTDVEQLRTMDPDELRVYTEPWGDD